MESDGRGEVLFASRASSVDERDCPRREGCTEAVLLAHGFTIEQMVELVHEGLATATAEGEVDTLWITEKGRRTLERLRS